jgi:membrane protease YdiL (CAAX protease family)
LIFSARIKIMHDSATFPTALIVFEAGCWLAGIILLWRLFSNRLGSRLPALAPWSVSLEGFVTGGLIVIACGWLLPHVPANLSNDVLGPAARDGDWWLFVQGAAFQLGLLGGALLAGLYLRLLPGTASSVPSPLTETMPRALPTRQPVLAGTITFLISIPLISGIGFGWKSILAWLNFSTGEQDMVDLFRNADDPLLLLGMIILAAVLAPVTEELLFRAGLFRYLRTRVSKGFALGLPALIFAVLHGNLVAFVPLFVLGVLFAYAYERTGRIAVPMIAHALFNLHTIVLAMAGVGG